MSKAIQLTDQFSFSSIDDKDIYRLIEMVRQGIKFSSFANLVGKSPFNISEWSGFLHLSERTMQRYKKEKTTFGNIHSEKILQLTLLFKFGTEVFGTKEKFNTWLEANNVALGKVKPKDLLDNSFGIEMLKDELTRIEHGILA
ncbi:MAG: antitoxin Xre/MbcA/ParS toxin-binding domain-containing protein [Bacteroidota bacterium]